MDELLLVGRVGRPHGVRGELKIIPETDDPERFADLDTLYLGASAEQAEARGVESVRFQPSQHGITVVVKLEGIASREQADALRQRHVYAAVDDLPPLDEGEVYLHDLLGLEVVTEEGERVGTVSDILTMPAHDVYVVSREGRPDAMIPAVPEFVVDLDLEEGRMVIRPIEGLLD